MSDGRVLPINASAGVITFKVLVDGKEVPNSYEFLSITIDKVINRIPTARLVLKDGSAAEEDFPISNAKTLIPGNKIEIKAGYDSKDKTIFKGVVIKHGIQIREGAGPVLVVECKDEAFKMTIGRKNKYFMKKKDSDVISGIIADNGLKKKVKATKVKHDELIQYYATDWDFMLSRAEMNGMVVVASDGEVSVAPPEASGSPVLSLRYGGVLFEFEAEVDARYQYKKVTASSWDYKTQKILEKSKSNPSSNKQGNLKESKLADVAGLSDYELRHSGKVIGEELTAWADAAMVKSNLAKVRGRAKIQGYPELIPGDVVEFQGVGDRFNGKAYVAGVRQELADGTYYTHIQFGQSPDWFYREFDVVDAPAAGLLPGINGLQIGKVTKLEGDPDGEDRIQVVLPIIDGKEKGIWARLASLDAGKERGYVFRPEIDDEVIVGFINDDPRDAVVLGMLHSSKLKAPIPPSDKNHEKGLVTRSKMRVWFDDEKKVMTFDTPAGNMIEISEDTKSITIQDQNKNKIVLNDKGIEISTPKDINLKATGKIIAKATQDFMAEGLKVGIKAQTQLKAEGGAGAELSTSAIAIIKGSLVKIN
ncbi:MAG: type VI secretion system tip protein VgrG [Lewinellaceae bacterium]|nr:type VI secretion system tip protein VgrG [Lewinellaceae bacterium]